MLRAVRRKVCRSIDRWMDKGSFGAAENDSVAQRSGNVTGVNSRIMTWIMRWHSSDSRRYRSLNSFWSTSSCSARAAVGYRAARRSCAFAATAVTVCSARFGLASHVLH
jgi:hypothetical protein